MTHPVRTRRLAAVALLAPLFAVPSAAQVGTVPGKTSTPPAARDSVRAAFPGPAPADDGLRLLDAQRFVATASRAFLSFSVLWGEDSELAVAPDLEGGEPWLASASSSAASTDAFSNSTGLARQHSVVLDLGGFQPPGVGGGALIAIAGDAAVAESSTPNFNWLSDADAASHGAVTFELDAPFRYTLSGRLVAAPDPSPILPGTTVPDGIEDHGELRVALRRADAAVFAHALDLERGEQVLDLAEDGVLQPGTYTFTARGMVWNDRGFAFRAGRGEARFGVLLDLAPLRAATDPAARAALVEATGWSPPEGPLALCSGPIVPAPWVGFEVDAESHVRRVRASSSFQDGAAVVDPQEEEAAGEGTLSFVGAVSARSAPPDSTDATDAFAHQLSSVYDIGVLRATGAAGARSAREAGGAGGPAGQTDGLSEFAVEFTAATPSTVELEARLEASHAGVAPALSGDPGSAGSAGFELARIDEDGAVLETLSALEVGGVLPVDTCQELGQTLVLPAGRYRLSAQAVASADTVGAGLSASASRFDVELREVGD